MNILLTGALGFIGTSLKKKLQTDHNIIELQADINNEEEVSKEVSSLTFDIVVHLAAKSHPDDFKTENEHSYYTNTISTAKLYQEVLKSNPQALFIFPSTAHVYSIPEGSDEILLNEKSPAFPYNDYANSKFIAEGALKSLAEQLNGNLCILRIFNHVHKTQPETLFMSSVYQQLISQKGKESKALLDLGNVDSIRDISPVQNLIDIFLFLIDNHQKLKGTNTFNACSGIGKSLRSIIDLMAQKLEINYEITVNPQKLRKEPRSIIGDNKKLANFGWKTGKCYDLNSLVDGFLNDLND